MLLLALAHQASAGMRPELFALMQVGPLCHGFSLCRQFVQ